METIIWKSIPGYEGLYEVSQCGKVKRLPVTDRPVSNNLLLKEKILTSISYSGYYLYVGLRKNNKYKTFPIHRLVALAFIPNPENRPFINHKDLNKGNNHISNLEWCTAKENSQHYFQCIADRINSLLVNCEVRILKNGFKSTITHKEGNFLRLQPVPEGETYPYYHYSEIELLK